MQTGTLHIQLPVTRAMSSVTVRERLASVVQLEVLTHQPLFVKVRINVDSVKCIAVLLSFLWPCRRFDNSIYFECANDLKNCNL